MRARWRATRLATAIADAMDRLDHGRSGGGELRAQVADMGVDRALADVMIAAVDRGDQLAARQDAPAMRAERREEPQLRGRDIEELAGDLHLVAIAIDRDLADREHRKRGGD